MERVGAMMGPLNLFDISNLWWWKKLCWGNKKRKKKVISWFCCYYFCGTKEPTTETAFGLRSVCFPGARLTRCERRTVNVKQSCSAAVEEKCGCSLRERVKAESPLSGSLKRLKRVAQSEFFSYHASLSKEKSSLPLFLFLLKRPLILKSINFKK